jgi:hypothetical protein
MEREVRHQIDQRINSSNLKIGTGQSGLTLADDDNGGDDELSCY